MQTSTRMLPEVRDAQLMKVNKRQRFTFSRTTTVQIPINGGPVSGSADANTGNVIQFNMNQLPNWSDFANLFDQFRLLQLQYFFDDFPAYALSPAGTGSTALYQVETAICPTPSRFITPVGSATGPSSADMQQLESYQTFVIQSTNATGDAGVGYFTRVFAPTVNFDVVTNTNAGNFSARQSSRGRWYDTVSATGTPADAPLFDSLLVHFSQPAEVTPDSQTINVRVTAIFQCRFAI